MPTLIVLAGSLLLPLAAFASPTVALHPTEVVGDQSDGSTTLHALVASGLSGLGVNLTFPDEVRAFLDKRNDKSCIALAEAERTACMAELARAVGAARTVIVTIAPFVPKKLLLSGIVVGRDGTVIQSLPAVEYPRPSNSALEPVVKKALADFLPRLDVFKLDVEVVTQPAVAVSPIHAPPPLPPPAAVEPAPTSASGRQKLAIAGLIAGTVFAGLGTWGIADSNSRYGSIDGFYAGGALPPASDGQRISDLRVQAQRSRTLGLVGLGLGAAAVGTSIYLLASSPGHSGGPAASSSSSSSSSAATLLVGPMSVGVSIPLH